MAGIYRQTGQHGDYNYGEARWKATLTVSPGDLVFRDTDGYDKPGSQITYQGSGAVTSAANTTATQELFKETFRGVSTARRLAAQTADGTHTVDGGILTSGEFELLCSTALANQSIGNMVALGNNANAMYDACVTSTANASLAIGKVSRTYTTGAGYIYVRIFPPLETPGGIQAQA